MSTSEEPEREDTLAASMQRLVDAFRSVGAVVTVQEEVRVWQRVGRSLDRALRDSLPWLLVYFALGAMFALGVVSLVIR